MSTAPHPAATDHLPSFITGPGETDVLMVVMAVFLVVAVLAVGTLFLRLHTLPERIAHKGHKLQFEVVAILGLLALFTHVHLFWVIGLLLAVIDIPDFGSPLQRMASSLEKLAGVPPDEPAAAEPEIASAASPARQEAEEHIPALSGAKPHSERMRPALASVRGTGATHA